MLQDLLKSKKGKLGNHWRMKIWNCINALTTLPVESCNNALKYVTCSINSNVNLDTTCGRILNREDSRMKFRRNDAKRDQNNYAS